MIHDNEILMLALGTGLYVLTFIYKTSLRYIPDWRMFMWAYRLFLTAWLATVLEGFFFVEAFNILEHSCYAGGMVMLAVWCGRVVFAETRTTE